MKQEIVRYDLNKFKWELLFLYFKISGRKIKLHSYYGKKILDGASGNMRIIELLKKDEPFAVCRLGYNELRAVMECYIGELKGNMKITEKTKALLCENAGFFPAYDEYIYRFYNVVKESLSMVDLLGVWNNKMEDFAADRFAAQTELCELRSLEPYYYDAPWSGQLEGKKVLVVHPFSESIMEQYKKREHLFQKPVLPELELYTLKAVQTIAGEKDDRFATWFDALEYMYNEALAIDFDIAILGCGAYGLPLAAKLKSAGKKAIHMGGATQILFGIKGHRWDNHPVISGFYNDYWVRPSDIETPQKSRNIENSCYW